MTRRDSPFHLRPRPALLPWLARFGGGGAAPAARAAATAHAAHAGGGRACACMKRRRARCPPSFTRRGILSVLRVRGRARGAPPASGCRPRRRGRSSRRWRPGLAGAIQHPGEAHCDPGTYVAALLAGVAAPSSRTRGRDPAPTPRRRAHRGLDTTAGPLHGGHRRARRRRVDARPRPRRRRPPPARGREGLPRGARAAAAAGRHADLHGGRARRRDAARRAAAAVGHARSVRARRPRRSRAGRTRCTPPRCARCGCRPMRRTVQVWRGPAPVRAGRAPDRRPRRAGWRISCWPPGMPCSALHWRQ